MNKATVLTAPLTAVSIIEVFGDVKNFQDWAISFLDKFSEFKELLFFPLSYIGIDFSELQQSSILIVCIIYFSHVRSTSKYFGEYREDHRPIVMDEDVSDNTYVPLVRPVNKFHSYLDGKRNTIYYLAPIIITLYYLYQYQDVTDLPEVLKEVLYSLFLAKVLKDLYLTYGTSVIAKQYSLKEAWSVRNYMQHMRYALRNEMISQQFFELESYHCHRVMVKLRFNYDSSKNVVKNTILQIGFVVLSLLVLLTCFVLIKY